MTDAPSLWTAGAAPASGALRHAPATARNRDAIVEVLRDALPASGMVLEVASGSGEHGVYFAATFPHLDWQPTDADPSALWSIAAWREEAGLSNLRAPLALDAAARDWPIKRADAILCINMVHISPWGATLGLMRGAGTVLLPGGLLYLYGPYLEADVETASSNRAFDASLRVRDAEWGLRTVDTIVVAARENGLSLERRVEMPANNLSLLFRRN